MWLLLLVSIGLLLVLWVGSKIDPLNISLGRGFIQDYDEMNTSMPNWVGIFGMFLIPVWFSDSSLSVVTTASAISGVAMVLLYRFRLPWRYSLNENR